jgi:hypothetical protein
MAHDAIRTRFWSKKISHVNFTDLDIINHRALASAGNHLLYQVFITVKVEFLKKYLV